MSKERKAVILAAGVGSRLGDITREVPKPLIEVGGRPILDAHLSACAAAGVGEVFINTHHLAEKIREFAGDGSRYGLAITYSYEEELLGTAGALNNFRAGLGNSPFAVIYGDKDIGAMNALFAKGDGKGLIRRIPAPKGRSPAGLLSRAVRRLPISGTKGVFALLAYHPCVRLVYQPVALPERGSHAPDGLPGTFLERARLHDHQSPSDCPQARTSDAGALRRCNGMTHQ